MTRPAPISQIYLTIQFEPAAKALNMLNLMEIRSCFVEEFPIFNQVARAGPMPIDFSQNMALEFGTELPRIQLLSEDLESSIFIQDDRVTLGWNRTAPLDQDSKFPGFDKCIAVLNSIFNVLKAIIEAKTGNVISPVVGEMNVSNTFAMSEPSGKSIELDSIFPFIKKLPSMFFADFGFTFRSQFSGDFTGGAEASVQGFFKGPNFEFYTNLQTVVRADMAQAEADPIATFQSIRACADDIFSDLVNSEWYAI